MNAQATAVLAVAIVLFALVSRSLSRRLVTMPMVFVLVGVLTDATGLVTLETEVESVAVLAEVTLALLLFSDAIRIDLRALRREFGLPARLLGIGLPLTVVMGTLGVSILLPGLSIWEAALLAAILAPTDAALGQAVVEDPAVPQRVRQGLNVESGLNDGLVVPMVALFVALSLDESGEPGFWVEFVLRQVAGGVVLGLLIGGVGAWLLREARVRKMVTPIYAQLATLSIGLLAFLVAFLLDANGFISAFVCGLTFGTVFDAEEGEHLSEYSEDTARILTIASFAVFGNLFVGPAWDALSIPVVLCAVGALTLARMVPVAGAVATMRPAKETVLFVGWFGPRGLASILFGLQLLEEELPAADELFGVITWTVLASIFLHGMTAGPGARAYGEWFAEMMDSEDGSDGHEMPEAVEVTDIRLKKEM